MILAVLNPMPNAARMLRFALALALAVVRVGASAAGEPVPLAWDVAASDCVHYTVSRLSDIGGQRRAVPEAAAHFNLFGYEIDAAGTLTQPVIAYPASAYHVLVALPARPLATGATWKRSFPMRDVPSVDDFRIDAEYSLVGPENVDKVSCWRIDARCTVADDARKRPAASIYKVRSGTLATRAWFDPARKLLLRGEFDYQLALEGRGQTKDYAYSRLERVDLAEVQASEPGALKAKIATAIARGVDYLKAHQRPDGSWGGVGADYTEGEAALEVLALVRSGVLYTDPVVAKGIDFVRKSPLRRTYSVALAILAMEAVYTPLEEIRESERVLDHPEALRVAQRRLPPADLKFVEGAVEWLLAHSINRERWGYGEAKGNWDNSNGQYAVLAFAAALRCGAKVPREAWLAVLNHWLGCQERSGRAVKRLVGDPPGAGGKPGDARELACSARGWSYTLGEKSTSTVEADAAYGSMTCAGVASVAIARAVLEDQKALPPDLAKRSADAVNDGLAWLEANYSVRINPNRADGWYWYYMYGLERACVLAQARRLGPHDWYAEGANLLVALQGTQGEWSGYTDTAFVLLFLKKATPPIISK